MAVMIHGSCLCGDVAFVISGEPLRMTNCHCLRCRRARSAAHACDLFVTPGQFRWTRGEQQVSSFLPDDDWHSATAFCRRCGSKLPRLTSNTGMIIVPAGSLDGDPGVRPGAHRAVEAKAPWFDITDDLLRCDL